MRRWESRTPWRYVVLPSRRPKSPACVRAYTQKPFVSGSTAPLPAVQDISRYIRVVAWVSPLLATAVLAGRFVVQYCSTITGRTKLFSRSRHATAGRISMQHVRGVLLLLLVSPWHAESFLPSSRPRHYLLDGSAEHKRQTRMMCGFSAGNNSSSCKKAVVADAAADAACFWRRWKSVNVVESGRERPGASV